MFRKPFSDPHAEARRRWQDQSMRSHIRSSGAAERMQAAQAKRDRKNAKRAAILARHEQAG
jgi:hypothetical protein